LRDNGFGQSEIDDLLGRWVVTKHLYVAPTDAEAQSDAHGPEMWYRDAFIRSLSAENLHGLHQSVYDGANAMLARLRSQSWGDLLQSALLIGSPETVAQKIDDLEHAGVGELVCWMNFGGLSSEKVHRSMRMFAEEVMPRFRRARSSVAA
jgi:alkanesulfonate monooxygenase SsuD/methylene tetrahydromethanopterin reductase-like flavin-dependent oxidoreductase (luciferase family)